MVYSLRTNVDSIFNSNLFFDPLADTNSEFLVANYDLISCNSLFLAILRSSTSAIKALNLNFDSSSFCTSITYAASIASWIFPNLVITVVNLALLNFVDI